MKDPVQTHKEQSKKLNEIFGRIKKLFTKKPSSHRGYNAKLTKQQRFDDYLSDYVSNLDSDKQCQSRLVGKKYNPSVKGIPGSSEVTINGNKIANFDKLQYQLGSTKAFRKFSLTDFKCYDLIKDPYGIEWLFDEDAKYQCERLEGKLLYKQKCQKIGFYGKWEEGEFNGIMMGEMTGGMPGPCAKFPKPKNISGTTTNQPQQSGGQSQQMSGPLHVGGSSSNSSSQTSSQRNPNPSSSNQGGGSQNTGNQSIAQNQRNRYTGPGGIQYTSTVSQ